MSLFLPLLVQLGSFPALPAQSCKEIKANEGGQAVSGSSWLDPTGSGELIMAYCDMNTEGLIIFHSIPIITVKQGFTFVLRF